MLKITPLPSKIPAHVVLYPRLLKRIQPLPSTKKLSTRIYLSSHDDSGGTSTLMQTVSSCNTTQSLGSDFLFILRYIAPKRPPFYNGNTS